MHHHKICYIDNNILQVDKQFYDLNVESDVENINLPDTSFSPGVESTYALIAAEEIKFAPSAPLKTKDPN